MVNSGAISQVHGQPKAMTWPWLTKIDCGAIYQKQCQFLWMILRAIIATHQQNKDKYVCKSLFTICIFYYCSKHESSRISVQDGEYKQCSSQLQVCMVIKDLELFEKIENVTFSEIDLSSVTVYWKMLYFNANLSSLSCYQLSRAFIDLWTPGVLNFHFQETKIWA